MLADAHDAVDSLAAGEELRLGQDRGTPAACLATVTAPLLLGLDARAAAHRGDLVLGPTGLADLDHGVGRILGGQVLHLLGDPGPATATAAATGARGLRGLTALGVLILAVLVGLLLGLCIGHVAGAVGPPGVGAHVGGVLAVVVLGGPGVLATARTTTTAATATPAAATTRRSLVLAVVLAIVLAILGVNVNVGVGVLIARGSPTVRFRPVGVGRLRCGVAALLGRLGGGVVGDDRGASATTHGLGLVRRLEQCHHGRLHGRGHRHRLGLRLRGEGHGRHAAGRTPGAACRRGALTLTQGSGLGVRRSSRLDEIRRGLLDHRLSLRLDLGLGVTLGVRLTLGHSLRRRALDLRLGLQLRG